MEAGKIAVLAAAAVLCGLTVKKQAPELAVVLGFAAAAAILSRASGSLHQVRTLLDELGSLSGLPPAVIAPVIKTAGIGILTRLTASFCRDAGESGVASAVELAGSIIALAVTIPLLNMVLDLIMGLW